MNLLKRNHFLIQNSRKLNLLFIVLLAINFAIADYRPIQPLDIIAKLKGESLTDTYNRSDDGENSSNDGKVVQTKFSSLEMEREHQEMLETLNNVVRIMGTAGHDTPADREADEKSLVSQVLNLMQTSKNNVDVITQAFRFVRLDAHLATLLSQLNQLRETQESLQTESIKQQTKFSVVLDEIRSLAAKIEKESKRMTEMEERLESEMETMTDRVDTAIEKVIEAAVSTQMLLDLSKETIQQTDKSVGISNEVLSELREVRSELGDVGQASVQAIYNVQKLEESLLMAMEETGNKTIYALRQDQQLQYQLFPLASPMKMDVDGVSLVPLGNSSIGNFMQADGTILPESTSLPDDSPVSSTSQLGRGGIVPTSIQNRDMTSEMVGVQGMAKNDDTDEKQKIVQNMRNTNTGTGTRLKSLPQDHYIPDVSPCLRKISSVRPRSCEEIQILGHATNGVYRIYPFDQDLTHNGNEVYCDLTTDGGGWTVIQRRKESMEGIEDFEKSWQEYTFGFGSLLGSHWIGLNTISEMTKSGDLLLRVELQDWEADSRLAEYGYFRVANSSELFKLFVTDYSGTAGDSLAYHNGMPFTTNDEDNDLEKNVNCAVKYRGAWWYKSCHQANLNGLYIDESNGKHESYANGVNWYSWHGYYYSLKRTEMKIRNRHFQPSP